MKPQGHLRDYPLLDLLEILANRRDSGCLRIDFEPEPAHFYFKDGQLVGARMALLQGLPAINLAFSMAKAPFEFDSEVIPPDSTFSENERLVLTRILGARLSGETEIEKELKVSMPMAMATNQPSVSPNSDSASVADAKQLSVSSGSNSPPVKPPAHLSVPPGSHSVDPEPVSDVPQRLGIPTTASSYLPRQRLFRAFAVILVIAVPAAVGITVRFGKRSASRPVVPVVKQATGSEESLGTQRIVVEDESTPFPSPETLTAADATATQAIDKNPRPPAKEIYPEPPSVIEEHERGRNSEDLPSSANQKSSAEPVSKTIVVVIRIEAGRVTEAWVKGPRNGLAAYEATAIRLVRQRRYSKETTRTEAVAVSVTANR